MVAKVMETVEQAAERHTGLARKVLDYVLIMKRIIGSARDPGFSEASWAPLAELVAVDTFQRVGSFKEVVTWPEYVGMLTRWAPTAQWDGSFKRITEADGVVLLELEERLAHGSINSVTVYEFDEAGKVRHLDIYLQMAPSGSQPAEQTWA
jgi:hypothetical protein